MSSAELPAAFVEAAGAVVRERTGLVFPDGRRAALAAGLAASMRHANTRDPNSYLAQLVADPMALEQLVGEITVGETYFFREPDQFEAIREEIIPALARRRAAGHHLRVWSAGCASGEEPYSIAILLRELGRQAHAHVLGTDLSRHALAKAVRGTYTRWSLRGLPIELLDRYFTTANDRFALVPAVRAAVEFRCLNLAEDTYPSIAVGVWGMDLILCRNVLIYFDADTVARVARRLLDTLSPDGWLLLGASDPPLAELVPCQVVVTEGGLAYRRADAGQVAVGMPPLPRRPEPPASHRVPVRAPEPTSRPSPPSPRPPIAPAATVAEETDAAARWYAARDYARAAEVARRAADRDGSDAAPWIVLVRALANRGDLVTAGRACVEALARHRESAELVYLQGVLLGEAGRYDDAAAAARRALYLDRNFIVAHLALGGALAHLEDPTSAGRAFRNAERLLAALPPDAIVPASDGEPAHRLATMAQVQLQLLSRSAA